MDATRFAREAIAFGITGAAAFLAYIGVMAVCIELIALGETLATALAFGIATLLSYVGNTLLTFRARLARRTLWRFTSVTLIGLGLNIALMKLVLGFGGSWLVGSVIVFTTVPAFNFIAHKLWSYRG